MIYESPRWLLLRGKIDDADKVIHKMATVNGKVLPITWNIEDIQMVGTIVSLYTMVLKSDEL